MATQSTILAWRRTEEPGGLQSVGSQRAGHDWATSLSLSQCLKGDDGRLVCTSPQSLSSMHNAMPSPQSHLCWWTCPHWSSSSTHALCTYLLLQCEPLTRWSWKFCYIKFDLSILKASQPWIFIGKTDAGAPIHWPPDMKNWLIVKDSDAGKDYG